MSAACPNVTKGSGVESTEFSLLINNIAFDVLFPACLGESVNPQSWQQTLASRNRQQAAMLAPWGRCGKQAIEND